MAEGPFRPRGGQPPPPAGHEGPEVAPTPPRPPRRRPPGATSQATWILGVFLFVALVYITINTLRTEAPGSRGVQPGEPMPVFAAPLVIGGPDRDANLAITARGGSPAACDVRGPGVFNLCDLTDRGPVVLAFMASRSERCVREIDALDRLRERFPDVSFAAVGIRGDRADLRDLIAEHGWEMPVAWDRDGAVANAYAVAVCPTVTFASKGGTVRSTTLGEADEAELARNVEAIR